MKDNQKKIAKVVLKYAAIVAVMSVPAYYFAKHQSQQTFERIVGEIDEMNEMPFWRCHNVQTGQTLYVNRWSSFMERNLLKADLLHFKTESGEFATISMEDFACIPAKNDLGAEKSN